MLCFAANLLRCSSVAAAVSASLCAFSSLYLSSATSPVAGCGGAEFGLGLLDNAAGRGGAELGPPSLFFNSCRRRLSLLWCRPHYEKVSVGGVMDFSFRLCNDYAQLPGADAGKVMSLNDFRGRPTVVHLYTS